MIQYTYHNIKDMEFSGVFDIGLNKRTNVNIANIVYYKYFLFIKFRDLVYIDIKSVGDIIIPFAELMKHEYLRKYYELSLVLIEDKHKIIEKKSMDDSYYSYDRSEPIYKTGRNWFINSTYFVEDFPSKVKKVEKGKYYNYFNINPNDLMNMCPANDTEVTMFYEVLKARYEYEQVRVTRGLNDMFTQYTNLILEYNIKTIGDEVEEISNNQDDTKNFANLLELNKKGLNADIFSILYNAVMSTKGQHKYAKNVPL
jgi:hypothetical protein